MTTQTIDLHRPQLDYRVDRGDDFADTFNFWTDATKTTNIDVSGRTFTAQLRAKADEAAVASMAVDMTDAATGTIILRLSAATTAALADAYVWDLQQVTGGIVRTLFGGTFVVARDVTHAG